MLSAFGTTELIIILAIAVLLFGASRLPQLGKGLGEGIRSFRDAIRGGSDEKKNLDAAPSDLDTDINNGNNAK